MPFNKNLTVTNPNRKRMAVADYEFSVQKHNKRVLEMLKHKEGANDRKY